MIPKRQATKRNKILIKSYNYVFDKKCYNYEILGKFILKEDFDSIIYDLNKLISKSMIENNKEEEDTKLSKTSLLAIFSSILLTITYIIMLSYSTSESISKNNQNVIYIISVILMALVLFIIFLLSVLTFISPIHKPDSMNDTIKSQIYQYLTYINNYYENYLEWIYLPSNNFIQINILKEPINAGMNIIENIEELKGLEKQSINSEDSSQNNKANEIKM
jgi:hypothetical protein